MKQSCPPLPETVPNERLIVGYRPEERDEEHSPSFGPLWKALNTVSELLVGYSLLGFVGFVSVIALGGALVLSARLLAPEHPLAATCTAVGVLVVGVFVGMRRMRRGLLRSCGRAELTLKGIRFAKPGASRKRIPWSYVQAYTTQRRWIQLRIGDREQPEHAIPTPTPEEHAQALAFLQARGISQAA